MVERRVIERDRKTEQVNPLSHHRFCVETDEILRQTQIRGLMLKIIEVRRNFSTVVLSKL